jgi:enoyl-CoA hydratase/carnithine racemase
MALARTLAAKPAQSLRAGKRAFYEQMEMASGPAYAWASTVIARCFADEEGREGMAAFLEKRTPPKR